MSARGYEFYLRVFNSISHEWAQRTSEISSRTREDKIHIHSGHVIFCLSWKHRINSCEKGAIYYVTTTTMISSRVKIWSFRGKAHLVFHWCLYNKNDYEPTSQPRIRLRVLPSSSDEDCISYKLCCYKNYPILNCLNEIFALVIF